MTETTTVAGTVPDVPTALALTPGDGQLGVSWTAPINNGGSAITGYSVQYRTGSGNWSDWPHGGTATTATITGLTNGTAYQVQVRTVNNIGNGPWSNAAIGTPAGFPAAPAAPTLTESSEQLTVVWVAPANNGGALTAYDVEYREGTEGDWEVHRHPGTGTSTVITGLTNGQSYQVQVRGRNIRGAGAWSDATLGTPFGALSVPRNVTLVAEDGAITVSWETPASTGGLPITGYKITYYPTASPGSSLSMSVAPVVRTLQIGGLTNGTPYSVRVAAVNRQGDGSLSTALETTPFAPSTPGVPTGLLLIPHNEQITASWTAPTNNGGRPITGYSVQYRTGSGNWSDWPHGGTGTSAIITGLTNGTSYQVRVAAINQQGTGSYTATKDSSPVRFTIPGVPSDLILTDDDTQLTIDWTAPIDTGGSALTGYSVQYRVGSGNWTDWPHGGTATTATITGLTNGTSYQVRVAAINQQGTGYYLEGVGIPILLTVPGVPTGLSLTPGNSLITASWTALHQHIGGRPITGYSVQYRVGSTGLFTDWPHIGTGTSAIITGLTDATSYDVQGSGHQQPRHGSLRYGNI